MANDSRNGALSHRSLHFLGAKGDHGHLYGGELSQVLMDRFGEWWEPLQTAATRK